MPTEDWRATAIDALAWVSKSEDTGEPKTAQDVKTLTEHPCLAVTGHFIQKPKAAKLNRVRGAARKDVGQHTVIAWVGEHCDADENATVE